MNAFSESERFMRQMLMIRYNNLLQTIKAKFSVTDEQMKTLENTILTIDWIDTALNEVDT
ncbi:MAG: hypothetical protein EBU33_02925 [Sphingobacteriia bacterium]|nr:hypothetical protein [Sphingobacteriia bacterium]